MIQAQQQIDLFHTLYTICLVLFVAGILLTAALFFILDIRKIFGIKTGRSMQQTVRQMEEQNEKTGRLIREQPSVESGDITSKKLRKTGRLSKNTQNNTIQEPSMEIPVPENSAFADTDQTSYLHNNHPMAGADETSVLSESADEPAADQTYGKFIIEKSVVYIHTKEIV